MCRYQGKGSSEVGSCSLREGPPFHHGRVPLPISTIDGPAPRRRVPGCQSCCYESISFSSRTLWSGTRRLHDGAASPHRVPALPEHSPEQARIGEVLLSRSLQTRTHAPCPATFQSPAAFRSRTAPGFSRPYPPPAAHV